ncbi:MAG: DUF4394 domain-containing protein [Pseudomonadota bacterium]
MSIRNLALSSAVVIATLGLAACGGGDDSPAPGPSSPQAVGDTVVLTVSGKLKSFNRTAPGAEVGSVTISGLTNESLLGIDYRPADGKLYGLSNTGNIFTIDPSTGVATFKSALRPLAGDDNPYMTLVGGTHFAVDFNPVADRLRVVSDTGLNLRINVDTGDTTTDGMINPAGNIVSAAAYTNSFAGTSTTQLFDLDVAAGRLLLQDPPNAGTVNGGVPLGLVADGVNGFDIDARTNTGYAALRLGADTALYSINLGATAGAATRIGAISGDDAIRGLAVAPAARPTALALTSDNRLSSFDLRTPNTLASNVAVTGLGTGETLVGIDFRPRDGVLFGLTNAGKLYTIDATTGAAVLRATLFADSGDLTAPYTGLSGTVTGVDFNPAADRLRVITSDGQSLRIVVETATVAGTTVTAGATTTDGAINRASAPAVVAAAAYSNSFGGTTTTSLFNLERNTDQLTLQNPPNNGTLTDIGPIGIDISGAAAFDIGGGSNGLALAALRAAPTGPFTLYNVSLTTGAATPYIAAPGAAVIGGSGGPANLIDLAIRF